MNNDFRLLVCGSRGAISTPVREYLIAYIEGMEQLVRAAGGQLTIISGLAQGPDRIAYDAAKARGIAVEGYRADWDTHGTKAGHLRNTQMLESGVDYCIAITTNPRGLTVGTANMVKQCKAAGVKGHVKRFPAPLTAARPARKVVAG
jgi:hypothetical protein